MKNSTVLTRSLVAVAGMPRPLLMAIAAIVGIGVGVTIETLWHACPTPDVSMTSQMTQAQTFEQWVNLQQRERIVTDTKTNKKRVKYKQQTKIVKEPVLLTHSDGTQTVSWKETQYGLQVQSTITDQSTQQVTEDRSSNVAMSQASSSTTTQSTTMTSSSSKMARYSLGIRWTDKWIPAQTGACFVGKWDSCLTALKLTGEARLGNLPFWMGVGVGMSSWDINIRYEF